MRRLDWKKKPEASDYSKGLLILLLIIAAAFSLKGAFAGSMTGEDSRDGNQLVFSQDEMSAFYKVTLGIPISINRETEHGLTAIPGIGPKLAERIIKERTERGGFKYLYEIKSVNGVGEKLYNKIIPYIELF